VTDTEHLSDPTLDTEDLILQVRDHIDTARSVPMSASVMVNRDELVAMLEEAVQMLPEEIRQARWLLKEREEFLAKARREAEDIIDAGRQQAQRMVEKTEVVREANLHARRIVDDAEKTSRDLKHEAEDYIDQKLASFEVVLERTMSAVSKGRERLQVVMPAAEIELDDEADDANFFDQDIT
jgi:F0F1-type ATP synthase membrane subunit b/b'